MLKILILIIPMYNLIEYSNNYWKTSGSLWQYFKDLPDENNNDKIVDFSGTNVTDSFNFKTKKKVRLIIMEEQIILK